MNTQEFHKEVIDAFCAGVDSADVAHVLQTKFNLDVTDEQIQDMYALIASTLKEIKDSSEFC